MKIVNAFPGGPAESYRLVLVQPDGSQVFIDQTYDYFRSDGTRIQSRTWKDRQARIQAERDPVLEGDLSLVRRHLADHPEIEIARPRICWIDLETDPRPGFERKRDMRILVASCYGEDGRRQTSVLQDWSKQAEAKLLTEIFEFTKNYDAISSWNLGYSYGDLGFDAPVIRGRCEDIWPGSSRRLNKYIWLDHLHAFKRLHLLFADSGDERSSYSLDAVSYYILGERKYAYDARDSYTDWEAGGSRRAKLVEYCEDDVGKLPRIEAKTGILALAYEVARLCGCLNDTSGLHPSTFVDSYLLRLAGQRGLRLPTKPEDFGHRKKFTGAFVFEPQARGVEKNIFSCDIGSLYPSVYQMLNASPETKGKSGCVSPQTGITFAQEPQGIVPAMLAELGKLKKHWKNEYKKFPEGTKEYLDAFRTHNAVKSIVNSIYGVGGSKYFRTFDKDISESITLTGQFIIKTIAKEIESRGWTVLQGDTDSTFIKGATESDVRKFLEYINSDVLPSIAKAHRCERPPPVLEFDSAYERMIVLGKKKYCCRYRDSDEIIVRGLEYRRGDASPLARKLQEQCVRKLLVDCSEDPEDFPVLLIAMRDHVLYGELPSEEIVLSESIRKPLDEYEVTSPALSAARMLASKGADVSVGTKIKFVVVDGSVSPMRVTPVEEYDGNADRFYYWEHLIFPPTERLLAAAFPDHDWTSYARVRPAKARDSKEAKYQAKLEAKGQIRIPGT